MIYIKNFENTDWETKQYKKFAIKKFDHKYREGDVVKVYLPNMCVMGPQTIDVIDYRTNNKPYRIIFKGYKNKPLPRRQEIFWFGDDDIQLWNDYLKNIPRDSAK
jgi:hypothetical protein